MTTYEFFCLKLSHPRIAGPKLAWSTDLINFEVERFAGKSYNGQLTKQPDGSWRVFRCGPVGGRCSTGKVRNAIAAYVEGRVNAGAIIAKP